jgi:hypothetical protein
VGEEASGSVPGAGYALRCLDKNWYAYRVAPTEALALDTLYKELGYLPGRNRIVRGVAPEEYVYGDTVRRGSRIGIDEVKKSVEEVARAYAEAPPNMYFTGS